MSLYVANQLVKQLNKKRIQVEGAKVLMLGLTFKENCPDIRNTKVVDIVTELQDFNIQVDVYDPWVNVNEAQHEYGITPIAQPASAEYDAIIIAVAHDQFKQLGEQGIRGFGKENHVLYDLKYILNKSESDIRL